eukprot:2884751-Pyramimonas_sp.AAC.1
MRSHPIGQACRLSLKFVARSRPPRGLPHSRVVVRHGRWRGKGGRQGLGKQVERHPLCKCRPR